METLWQFGRDQLQGQHMFFAEDLPPDAPHPDFLHQTVCMRDGKPTGVISVTHLPATDLAAFLSTEESNDASCIVPELRLVRLDTTVSYEHEVHPFSGLDIARRPRFKLARAEFVEIFTLLNADPWALWLLSNSQDGFHLIPATDRHPDTHSYGLARCALIWTFSPSTARTRCLLVARNVPARHDDIIPLEDELPIALLPSLAPHLWTPYVLLVNAALTTMMDLGREMDWGAGTIARIEKTTDIMPLLFGSEKAALEGQLANLSSRASRVRISGIRILHHHDNAMRALSALAKAGPCPTDGASYATEASKACHYWFIQKNRCLRNGNPAARFSLSTLKREVSDSISQYDRSMANMRSTIPVLEARAATFRSYSTSIMQRAEAQANVVFALLTHKDSMSNLKVAMAAKDTAAAAKRDSSAMKTIAAMTMAFLPATFLAALFALPALEWDRKKHVDADGFVLFWSAAIPLTLAVFLVWALITQRAWIKGLVPRKESREDAMHEVAPELGSWSAMSREFQGLQLDPPLSSHNSAAFRSASSLGRTERFSSAPR